MPVNTRILVTGANGQLGRSLREQAANLPGFNFLFTTRDELPLTDTEKLNSFFHLHQPGFCINAAAYTAVDKAESKEEIPYVFAINAEAVKELAMVCQTYSTRLIQVSTDYVFDGRGTVPYKEDDSTHPLNVYGESKLKGEEFARQLTDAVIVRTSWVYSPFGHNFVKTMLRLMKERDEINVVSDQWGSPTYAPDLAAAILAIIGSPSWQKGIYHYTNEGVISWYDFAEAIKEFSGSTCVINPITTVEYPTAAKRPAYSVLDTTKIRQVFGISLKNWMDSLADCLLRLRL